MTDTTMCPPVLSRLGGKGGRGPDESRRADPGNDARALIATIEACAQVLAESVSPQCKDYLDRISACARSLDALAADWPDSASSPRDSRCARKETILLNALLRDAAADFRLLSADEKRVSVIMDAYGEPRTAADAPCIRLVLQHLLAHALRRAPSGTGRIHLAAYDKDHEVIVEVGDDGEALEPNALYASMMESEFVTSGRGGKSGLALSRARRIVEEHGGRLWAERGASGRGARICFSLPRIVGEHATAPVPPTTGTGMKERASGPFRSPAVRSGLRSCALPLAGCALLTGMLGWAWLSMPRGGAPEFEPLRDAVADLTGPR